MMDRMNPKVLMTPDQIAAAVLEMSQWILNDYLVYTKGQSEPPKLAIIGIRKGGDVLAKRVADYLSPRVAIHTGALDITLYRDDTFAFRGSRVPILHATHINFSLNGVYTVLVDDVLFTGRTIRAALFALNDFGRSSIVRLATLVDRGGRQVPISSDYASFRETIANECRVEVLLKEMEYDRDEVLCLSPKIGGSSEHQPE